MLLQICVVIFRKISKTSRILGAITRKQCSRHLQEFSMLLVSSTVPIENTQSWRTFIGWLGGVCSLRNCGPLCMSAATDHRCYFSKHFHGLRCSRCCYEKLVFQRFHGCSILPVSTTVPLENRIKFNLTSIPFQSRRVKFNSIL